MKLIFIDAGHGLAADGTTPDNGAQGIVSERKEVLEIAKEVMEMLRKQPWASVQYLIFGIGVEKPMTLADQVKEVNRLCGVHGASMSESVLVSIHANKASGVTSGAETWYEGGNNVSKALATSVLNGIVDETKLPNRGVKSDLTNRHGRLAIVRDVTPMACLVECGFVDHQTDAGMLKDALKDDAFARGIVKGLCEHLDEKYTPIYLDGVFADVSKERWSAEAIQYVKDKGIMRGDGNMFRPTDPVTREELAVILKRINA